jgi:hypothetical protein
LEVEIGGKIYWDLNEDDAPGITEGVEDVLVVVLGNSTDVDTNVTTDASGVWSLFVPVHDNYTVSVSKEGFGNKSYNLTNSSAYPVENNPESHDLEVLAGNVAVSGNVTDIKDASRLVNATIVLYPTLDAVRDPISINGVFANDVLTWDSEIAPGQWIVVVTQASPDENGGGVAVGLLDATIANGATLDLEMKLGGWVDLTTEWTDFALSPHHAGAGSDGADKYNGSVDITISIGDDAWNMPLSDDGTLTILVPTGDVDFDSTFMTIQHEDLLDMEYIAGGKTSVGEGRSPVNMVFTRTINSDSTIVMSAGTVSNATLVDGDETSLMAIPVGEAYETIEFDLNVAYEGTEVSDVFTVTGSIGAAQDSNLWSVEFFNGTAWVDSYDLDLGVGQNASDDSVDSTGTIRARVNVANQSEAYNFDDAHMVKVRMSTITGASSEISIDVQVPQTYGLEISDEVTELGIAAGSDRPFSFMLTNTGNGDDTFSISLADNIPEGWEVTPMQSNVPVAKDEAQLQLFTVFAPSDWDGSIKTVNVTVTSENGEDTASFDVVMEPAMISLRQINDGLVTLASDQTADVESTEVRIPIENFGYLDADSVIVSLTNQLTGESYGSQTISVAGLSTTNAVFEVGAMPSGSQRFEYHVEVAGEDSAFVSDNITDGDFSVEYFIQSAEDSDTWLTTVGIIILIVVVVFAGVKMSRGGSNTKRF